MLRNKNFLHIKKFSVENFDIQSSVLSVYNIENLIKNFKTKRFFMISASHSIKRGNHAHYKSKQILFCIKGKVKLTITNSINHKILTLNEKGSMVYIPPMLWAKQEYFKDSILGVFTNTNYEEKDYIRDYHKYKNYMTI